MDYQARLWLARIYGARLAVTYRDYKRAVDQARKRLEEVTSQEQQSDDAALEKSSESETPKESKESAKNINAISEPSIVFVVVRSISEYEALEQKDVVAVFTTVDNAKAFAEKEKLERGEELDVFEMPLNSVPKKARRVFSRKYLSHHHTSAKKRVLQEEEDDEKPDKSKKLKRIDVTADSDRSEEDEADEEEDGSADLIDDDEPHEAHEDDEEDSEDRAFINDEEVDFDDEPDGLPSDELVDSDEDE